MTTLPRSVRKILPVEIDDSSTVTIPFYTSGRRRKQRTDLSLTEKVDLIRLDTEGFTQSEIGRILNVSQSVVSRTLQNSKDIIADTSANICPNRKRFKTGKYSDLEKALLDWFIVASKYGVPISQSTLVTKSRQLATLLGYEKFNPHPSWWNRWREKNGVIFRRQRITKYDKTEVNTEQPSRVALNTEQPSPVASSLVGYCSDDIYSATEVGVYYNALPDDMLRRSWVGQSQNNNEQLTLLVACNQSGNDKRPLVIVGDRSLPGDVVNMPCEFRSNLYKSWMTTDVFAEWLLSLDAEMKERGRHIVVIVDHSPVHPTEIQSDLTNVQLKFLEPEIALESHPCEGGISRKLKYLYRHDLVQTYNLTGHTLSLVDTLHMLCKAWDNVGAQIIQLSFWKAGLGSSNHRSEVVEELQLIDGLSREESNKYVDFDFDLQVSGQVPDNHIISSLMSLNDDGFIVKTIEEFDQSCHRDRVPSCAEEKLFQTLPSYTDGIITDLSRLKQYIEASGITDFSRYNAVKSLVEEKIKSKTENEIL